MELTILGYTLAATGYTFAMTALGAASILLFKGAPSRLFTRLSLGFAAGIMIAASVWSLLSPAMEEAEQLGWPPALPCAGGFLLGAGFLILLDNITPHLHMSAQKPEGPETHLPKQSLLFFAITLHNIPEGITVALPVYFATGSKGKAMYYTFLSSISEPIGALMAFLVLRPFINDVTLGIIFGIISGIMLYIAIEELLPSSRDYGYPRLALWAAFAGICLMPLTLMF